MKGIVVEIRKKDAVILSDSGSVITIKNNNYQIGEEVQMGNTKKSKVKFIAVAAGFVIAFTTVGGGAYAYTTPYSYVSLDVNPSIEYSVNMFDRVIDANAVNEDGEAILSNIDVENKTIDEAIKETVSEINEQGYIPATETSETGEVENNPTGETGGIVISTSSGNEDKAEELAEELKTDVEEVIDENNLSAEVETLSVGKERVLKAKELGVTPGKLNLVEKLKESSANPDDIIIEEWLNKPVKEIMKATKANKIEQKVKPTEAVTDEEKEQNQATESKDTQSADLNVQSPAEKSDKAVKENKNNKASENKNASSTVSGKGNVNSASGEKINNKSENKISDKDVEDKTQNSRDNENKGNGKNK